MKKILVSLLLISVLTINVIAGGQQESTDSQKVNLKVLHYIGNKTQMEAWDEILKIYEASNPDIEFDSQSISQTEYFTQLRTRIAAGDPPDLMMGQPAQYPDIIDSGYVMDLTDNNIIGDMGLSEADLGDCSYNGRVYAFPLDFKMMGIFYNKDIYAKYGLEVPQTFQELIDICDTLKDKGVDPWIRNYSNAAYPDIEVRSIFWYELQKNGKYDAFEKLMSGDAKFQDYPEFAHAMELWTERMKNYSSITDLSIDYVTARQNFVKGEAAMSYEGTWAVGQLYDLNPDVNLGMFVMPTEDGSMNGYPYQIDKLFMVNGKSKNIDEVMKFVEFLNSSVAAGYWAANTLQPSVSPNVGDDIEMPEIIKEAMRAKQAGQIAHAGLWTAQLYGEFNKTYRSELQRYVAEKEYDIPKFIDELQDSFDIIIDSLK